ncbi:MAG: radical SAM protein [bacterium]
MKILLLQPPIRDFYDTDLRLQPIGLASLKAVARAYFPDLEIKILDFHHGWGRRSVAVPQELAYLKDYYPFPDRSPFCGFHQYYHFGAPYEAIVERVAAEAPDLIGISSLFSPYYREVLETARAIKRSLAVPILLGGSHVSADPLGMLGDPAVDFVIRGEGERPFLEFLRAWRSGADWARVPNLGWKRGGECLLNPMLENFPLDALPPPDFGDFRLETYRHGGRPLAFLVTSRSCPHRCSFCSVHTTFGLEYRRHSVERVIQEIRQRYAEGYRVLDFEDDNLTFYREEMLELCDRIVREFPDGDLQLLAMNGISYLSLDAELLARMRRAGFTHLNLSLVSSDLSVREATKRPHTVKKYLEVVEEAFRLGFRIVSYQILGLPQESLDSMVQTLVFAARLPVLLGASMFYLTPNSPLARQGGQPLSPKNNFTSRLTAMAIETPHASREDIYTLFLTTRILDFLKSLPAPAQGVSLERLFAAPPEGDPRTRLGLELLRELLATRILYAATPQGWRPLPRFKRETFERIWSRLDFITTQSGGRIYNTTATSGCVLRAV